MLWAFDLSEESQLLYCAAGKFAIDATGQTSIESKLDELNRDIMQWLFSDAHGRLRCTIVADDSQGTAAERNDSAHSRLQESKLRPWVASKWNTHTLIVPEIFDLTQENKFDANLGRRLVDGNIKSVELHDYSDETSESYAGIGVRFTSDISLAPNRDRRTLIPLDRIARHTPRDNRNKQIEFVDIALKSRGAPMLGILKADADSLGYAIRKKLGNTHVFDPLKQFSQKLDKFFGKTLDREMSSSESRWNNIYTVFAGGDDLLLVGPWDIIIDFAAHVRNKFMNEFKSEGLTLSAGCAIVKAKFPIHLATQQAEEALERAKTGSKDQFAMLGEVWKWEHHMQIIDAGKQLADWVDAGDIQRGWLHTLLELILLRRGESTGRDERVVPEMATSRLMYHISRNWPAVNAPGEKGNARRWVEALLRHFDNFDKTTDPITKHLTAIIRYAMLATRNKGDEQ